MGLLQRQRVNRKGSTPLFRFVISTQGEDALALHQK